MADMNTFSERVIDYAERLADVSDAAQGRGIRRGSMGTRWLLLPAVGAGIYALATNGTFTRRAKKVMDEAKTRASELPDDLMGRVRQTSQQTPSSSGSPSRSRRKTSTGRKTSSSRRKSSARKTSSTR
jgi:hypothetical protein